LRYERTRYIVGNSVNGSIGACWVLCVYVESGHRARAGGVICNMLAYKHWVWVYERILIVLGYIMANRGYKIGDLIEIDWMDAVESLELTTEQSQ